MKKRLLYDLGLMMEVDEYWDGRYGARGEKRKEKRNVTPEQVRRQNQFNRTRRLRRRMRANFAEGDLYWTFTFSKDRRPESMQEAREIWTWFQRKLREMCKKQKRQFKWVIRIERGSRGALHIHLVMNAVDKPKEIAKLWTAYGHARLEYLYQEGGFADLAAYLTKPEEQGEETYYSHSRNLPIPVPLKEMIRMSLSDKDTIDVPEGYYLDKSSLIEGVNPVTGYPYRHYTLIKIRGDDG